MLTQSIGAQPLGKPRPGKAARSVHRAGSGVGPVVGRWAWGLFLGWAWGHDGDHSGKLRRFGIFSKRIIEFMKFPLFGGLGNLFAHVYKPNHQLVKD